MTQPIIYGVDVSPFVRKVDILLEEKGVAYELVPTRPGPTMPAEVRAHSPLGKIPTLRHGDKWLADSSVICLYLEKVYPQSPMLPTDPYDYARALWFEEYIDGAAFSKACAPIFFERVLALPLAGRPCDEARVQKTIAEELPAICDYLEGELGSNDYFVAGRFTLADITVAGFFVNLNHAGVKIDAARWPRLDRHYQRVTSRPSFARHLAHENKTLAGLASASKAKGG
jgi:glutathione S-transferase